MTAAAPTLTGCTPVGGRFGMRFAIVVNFEVFAILAHRNEGGVKVLSGNEPGDHMVGTETRRGTTRAHEKRPLHILVIEDYPDGRETLRMFLELSGYVVDVAADGIEGVEKALRLRPDVAIVDIGLPRLNGFEVAQRLRACLGRDICLAACTAYGQDEDREAALDAGFDLFLVKPIDADALLAWLEQQSG